MTWKNDIKDVKDVEAQDALASTIISKNVSQEVLNYIRYLATVYDIMEKIKKKKTCTVNFYNL